MNMVQESEEIRIAANGLELLGSPPRAKHGCRGFTIPSKLDIPEAEEAEAEDNAYNHT